jgi:hypothetical protein
VPDIQTVVILLVPTILAIAFAFIPRMTEGAPLRLVGVWLVLVAVAITAIGNRMASQWTDHQSMVNRFQSILILIICAAFAWLNRNGLPLVRVSILALVAGAGLNALATAVYGGMPVLRSAGIAAGNSPADMSRPHPIVGYVLSDQRGWFAHYAGDFIPVPDANVVFSIGDVLIWSGLATLLAISFRSVAPVRQGSSRPL